MKNGERENKLLQLVWNIWGTPKTRGPSANKTITLLWNFFLEFSCNLWWITRFLCDLFYVPIGLASGFPFQKIPTVQSQVLKAPSQSSWESWPAWKTEEATMRLFWTTSCGCANWSHWPGMRSARYEGIKSIQCLMVLLSAMMGLQNKVVCQSLGPQEKTNLA